MFLDLFKSPPKNGISWSVFSFGGYFKDSLWTFPKPQIYQPEGPAGNKLLNKKNENRVYEEKTSPYLCIPYNKSDLCVCLTKRRVCFPPPAPFILCFFWSLIWVTPCSGFFFFIWHGQIFEVELSFGKASQFHLTNLWSNDSNAGLQWPFCVLWGGWPDRVGERPCLRRKREAGWSNSVKKTC